MATYNSFKRIATDSFVANTITSSDVAAGAVTSGKIATNAVTSAKFASGAVGTGQLASSVDLSSKTVTYRTIGSGDISGSAGIGASKLASGAATTNLGYTPLDKSSGTMTGNLVVPAGSVGSPAVTLSGNTNTGLYFNTNQVQITTGGTNRATFDSAGRLLKGPDSSTGNPAFTAVPTSGWTYNNTYGGTGWREIASQVNWSTVYQRGGSNFSAGRFTAPVSGFYHFHWQTYGHNDNNEPPNYWHMTFTRNGGTGAWSGRTPHGIYAHGTTNGPYPHGVTMDLDLYLNSGEYSSVMFYWNGNGGRFHCDHSMFAGYLIG